MTLDMHLVDRPDQHWGEVDFFGNAVGPSRPVRMLYIGFNNKRTLTAILPLDDPAEVANTLELVAQKIRQETP